MAYLHNQKQERKPVTLTELGRMNVAGEKIAMFDLL